MPHGRRPFSNVVLTVVVFQIKIFDTIRKKSKSYDELLQHPLYINWTANELFNKNQVKSNLVE